MYVRQAIELRNVLTSTWHWCNSRSFDIDSTCFASNSFAAFFQAGLLPPDFEARRRLHSLSLASLIVRPTRLLAVGDRAFPVAAFRVTNIAYPQHVTSAPLRSVCRSSFKMYLFGRRLSSLHPYIVVPQSCIIQFVHNPYFFSQSRLYSALQSNNGAERLTLLTRAMRCRRSCWRRRRRRRRRRR